MLLQLGPESLPGYGRQYGCDLNSAMPTNLYGPADNFDLSRLIRKAHDAKREGRTELVIWGSGTPGANSCANAAPELRMGEGETSGGGTWLTRSR